MKILVINSGSSTIKYRLFDMARGIAIAAGLLERIGESQSRLSHETHAKRGAQRIVREEKIVDHQAGMNLIVDLLTDPEAGVIKEPSEITAIGHRVVHGGESFQKPVLIDEHVLAGIKAHVSFAPLHNPANLMGIETAARFFPGVPQVAVFDTAFHQTIPAKAFHYGVPYYLYETNRVRRYGFHGTSHQYVARKAAEYLQRPLPELNLITIHLGNGASITAIEKGRSVDTSMGLTPLEGLVMGTRSGDVDPALHFYLAESLGMSVPQITHLLNKESGLKGICGTNDMREILSMMEQGHEQAQLAFDIYTYRVKKYVGAYYAVLGFVDALVFTGGIGENAPQIRDASCQGLERLGIVLDQKKNLEQGKNTREIQARGSSVKVLVIPTDEEWEIACQTKAVWESLSRDPSAGPAGKKR